MNYSVLETMLGWVGLIYSDKGLSRLILPDKSEQNIVAQIQFYAGREPISRDDTYRWRYEIEDYFSGVPVNFNCELDLSRATNFQRHVWKQTIHIPYGEVRSYQWVAMQLGNKFASRAVGHALAKNPVPVIIPCHRVIYGDGKLGGFEGKPDISRIKYMLLNLEGVNTIQSN